MTEELTKEQKQNTVDDVTQKISAILAVNGLTLLDLNGKMLATLITVYQQGLKDAKDIFIRSYNLKQK